MPEQQLPRPPAAGVQSCSAGPGVPGRAASAEASAAGAASLLMGLRVPGSSRAYST